MSKLVKITFLRQVAKTTTTPRFYSPVGLTVTGVSHDKSLVRKLVSGGGKWLGHEESTVSHLLYARTQLSFLYQLSKLISLP